MPVVGLHAFVEMFGCPRELLDDIDAVRKALHAGAIASKGTLLGECSHDFDPQGVTVVGLLAESHISIHTWPEHGYAAADVFTCGENGAPEDGCRVIAAELRAARFELRCIARGVPGALRGLPPET